MSDFNVPGSRPNKNTLKFRKSTVVTALLISGYSAEGGAVDGGCSGLG